MPQAYYNELDPFAAAWLRELIAAKLIAPGHVDERSIEDVRAADLRGYTQCHFFAGIGVWSYALRLAGVPDSTPVWTGSCPCQPFSAAGKRAGVADERHLWPAFFHLIEIAGPPVVLGEQVASPDGLAWLDLVQADLEDAGYAVGAADLCAAGVSAPHIRQRLYWVADASSELRAGHGEIAFSGWQRPGSSRGDGASSGLADADGWLAGDGHLQRGGEHGLVAPDGRALGGMGNAELIGAGRDAGAGARAEARPALRPVGDDAGSSGAVGPPLPPSSVWRDPDWLLCRDDKWRPVESGTFPLADGAPARMGRLRGYGNALVAEQAATFIRALTVPNVA